MVSFLLLTSCQENNILIFCQFPDSIKAFLSDVPLSHLLPAKNAHPVPKVSVRETVRAINDAEAIGADSSEFYKLLADRKMIKVKMLKFKDDVRPGYLGE